MAIDFTLTDEQKKLQLEVRDFAENVLAPVVREADAEPDPLRAPGPPAIRSARRPGTPGDVQRIGAPSHPTADATRRRNAAPRRQRPAAARA